MNLRVVSTPIKGSPLAQLAIDGRSEWFVSRPQSRAEWRSRAELIQNSVVNTDWLTALAPAISARGRAAERLELAASRGIVVTTGQQPALFGGPLYTWWKALSAAALADRLQEVTGLPVAAVFWAATDDSDFVEAASTVVATAEGAQRIELDPPETMGSSLADTPLGDVSAQLARLVAAAGSAPNGGIIDIVSRAYTQDRSIGGAYVEFLRAVLSDHGVSVLDAAHPAVRTAGHSLLERALLRAEEIEARLADRTRELKAAGHKAQVKIVRGRTLVFADTHGKRDRVRLANAARVAASAIPGTLGPNVLLRPVMERSILPTVAYLGGPGEIAYFAQVTAVAEALDVPPPLVVPRWSGVLIEPRIQRILQRHLLEIGDFRDPHAVETRLAREAIPRALAHRISRIQSRLEQAAEDVAKSAGADLLPPGVIPGLKRNVALRIARLERRIAAAVKLRGTESLRDAAIARGALYPYGVPQERALNLVPFLARYGQELIAAVEKETRRHAEALA